MEALVGLIVGALGLVVGAWAAYHRGASDQRARTMEALAEAGRRRSQWEAEEDARIERDRLAAIEASKRSLEEHRDQARVDIDEAEAELRRRTEEPWEP